MMFLLWLEELRCELRGLMRFIPRGLGRRDVITHLDDPVTNIEYGATATTGEDFINYRLKVERYLRDYGNSLVIQKLHRNLPMTEYEFVELERIFTQELGTADDYERTYGETPFGLLVRQLGGSTMTLPLKLLLSSLTRRLLTSNRFRLFVKWSITWLRTGIWSPLR